MLRKKIISSLLITSLLNYLSPFAYSSSFSLPLSAKVLSLQKDRGAVFINKGSAEGIKEKNKILVLASGKSIALTVGESFTHTSKLFLQDSSDIQYLKEGEALSVSEGVSKEKTRISGESRSIVSDYNRGGQSRNKSFYRPGGNFRQEIDLKIENKGLKNVNLEGFISARTTDDKYVDSEQVSLERLYLNLEEKDKKYSIMTGDYFSYFSNYSLSQSLKGLKGNYKMENSLGDLNMVCVWGTNKHRWNDFWREIEGESYTRYVSGLRLEQILDSRKAKLGFNFVDSRDKPKSTSRIRNPSVNPITNSIFSSDFEIRSAERFWLKSELAHAVTDTNTAAGSSVKTKSDQAYKVDTILKLTKGEPLKGTLYSGYERAGQNFSSLSGILKTDRQEYYSRLNFDTYDYFSWRLGLTRSANNLKDGLAKTTKYSRNDIGFTLRPLESKRSFEIAIDLFRRQRYSSDTIIKEQTDDARLSLRDKFGRLSLWGSYQTSKHDDESITTNGRFSHLIDLGGRFNFDCQNFSLIPHLYLQFEKRKQDTTRFDNARKSLNSGVSLNSGERLSLRLNYAVSDINDDILLQNRTRQHIEFETQYFLDRQKTRDINISYDLDNLENKSSSRDYVESILKIEFRQRF